MPFILFQKNGLKQLKDSSPLFLKMAEVVLSCQLSTNWPAISEVMVSGTYMEEWLGMRSRLPLLAVALTHQKDAFFIQKRIGPLLFGRLHCSKGFLWGIDSMHRMAKKRSP
ncbi:hypothetical protein O204_22495 [Pseudomonas simiae]|uniref:Uncharacterized protein n=1 Tax=Pseudomonas simiae TaxID=321846 RepID=U1TNP8_9PSED|nr:hypothetical protein O204_22495 [Pseudomonas simiae]